MNKPAVDRFNIATTPDGMRLRRYHHQKSSIPVEADNSFDGFKLIMPTRAARVRLDAEKGTLFEGNVRPGTVRFVQPNERARVTPLTMIDEMILYIPGTVFRQQASVQGFNIDGRLCPQITPVIETNYAVRRLVPLLDLAMDMPPRRRQALIQGLATSLMALLLEPDLHRLRDGVPAFDEKQFERIIEFANARLGQHLDLSKWADAAALSPGDFARRFQQHTGIAPYTWFMDRRMDEAKRLLAQSDMPLVEIALEAGFCSQSHFTEAFRRRMGTSPGRWRRSNSLYDLAV